MRVLGRGPAARVDEVTDDEVVVAVTRDDLSLLANAVGEAVEAVEEWEFSTRLGRSTDEARAIARQITQILRQAFRPE